MRPISRVLDISIKIVTKLLEHDGNACAAFHNDTVRDVPAKRISVRQDLVLPPMREVEGNAGSLNELRAG